mgnify:CR=1 FL=1
MHDTLPSAPSRTEVRTALLWALENDRDALLEHRETTQHCLWAAARGAADRRLGPVSYTQLTLTAKSGV